MHLQTHIMGLCLQSVKEKGLQRVTADRGTEDEWVKDRHERETGERNLLVNWIGYCTLPGWINIAHSNSMFLTTRWVIITKDNYTQSCYSLSNVLVCSYVSMMTKLWPIIFYFFSSEGTLIPQIIIRLLLACVHCLPILQSYNAAPDNHFLTFAGQWYTQLPIGSVPRL